MLLPKPLTPKTLVVVALVALSSAGLGRLIGNTVLLKYKSEAVLNLEMTVPEYKRFSEAAASRPNALELLKTKLVPLSDLDELLINKELRINPSKWLTALPKLNKAEAKDLPDSLQKIALDTEEQQSNNNNNKREKTPGVVYVGARLAAFAPDAEQASRIVTWLGQYFKEVSTKEAVREQLSLWLADSHQFSDKTQSQQLKYAFEIEQAQTRALSLKRVLNQYPEYAKGDARQIIDINKGNEKFIFLGTQMLGAEAEIIDIREKMAKLTREQAQNHLSEVYLKAAEAAFKVARTGTAAVKALHDLTLEQLGQAQSDAEKEKLLSYAADLSKISARFLSQAQFVVAPSIPEQSEQPRPAILAALFGFLGLLASVAVVFRQQLLSLLASLRSDDT
jgi:dsDNA-binding SOS-regulon protein